MKKPLLLALLLLPAACAPKQQEPRSVGKAYFDSYGCLTCHRVGNDGANIGPDLTFVGYRKSREWLDDFMSNPHKWKPDTVMPTYYLKDDVRGALVDYLAGLKGQHYLTGQAPWDDSKLKGDPIKRGELIYNRVGCSGCHGAAGVGGYLNNNVIGGKIPSLVFAADGFSLEELKDKIRAGVAQSAKADPAGPAPMIHMPGWGEILKEDALDALAAYLFSLRPPKTAADDWSG